jgi:hypothetical protein
MTNGIKTMKDLESEEQALLAELTGVENALLLLHDKEWRIRTDLQHIEIQKIRMPSCLVGS